MATTAEAFEKLEFNNELSLEENKIMNSFSLDYFDNVSDLASLKLMLNRHAFKLDGEENPLTIVEIAEKFDMHVEKANDSDRKLKIRGTPAEETPKRIINIIENPKNNDLAFFIQKLCELINIQAAKLYTKDDLNIIKVKIDKVFGYQTKQALDYLANWILTYKYSGSEKNHISKEYIERALKNTKLGKENSGAFLSQYNLEYKDGNIVPKTGYKFLEPHSNNLAVYPSKEAINNLIKDKNPVLKQQILLGFKLTYKGGKLAPINGYKFTKPNTDNLTVEKQ